MNDRARLPADKPMIFAGNPLDRGDALRRDETALAQLPDSPSARYILFSSRRPLVTSTGALAWLERDAARALAPDGEAYFLGHWGEFACFALAAPDELDSVEAGQFTDTRQAVMVMPPSESGVLAQGLALVNWHASHPYCSRCGGKTRIAAGGAKRICTQCEAEHFPRVDPVVIMLATDGDHCLLGRQASWPVGMWSALAGFVEPGETLEEACARELHEEAGVKVDMAGIQYVFGQPWPFPSSLMIGLTAPVTNTALTVDTHELEAARWFSRQEIRSMMEGTHAEASIPPRLAIASRLLEDWINQD
ncbi:NAD(+) diphosphatase [Maricaulis sp. D1M11]|uniref:NAD(+) diphosphatase n=1 Tax=Maricaulis sp. D1M11 TaxID=3076117 RepID=UPI0039B65862